MNNFQEAILISLKQLSLDNMRRFEGYCYKELKTPEGHSTRFWIPTESIHEFVYGISKDYQFHLTSDPTMYEHVTDYLKNCKDPEFPEIKKNPNMRSYKNGIVTTYGGTLKFYKYGFVDIDETMTSSEYLDHDFPPSPPEGGLEKWAV